MLDVLHSLSLLALYSFLGLPGIGFFTGMAVLTSPFYLVLGCIAVAVLGILLVLPYCRYAVCRIDVTTATQLLINTTSFPLPWDIGTPRHWNPESKHRDIGTSGHWNPECTGRRKGTDPRTGNGHRPEERHFSGIPSGVVGGFSAAWFMAKPLMEVTTSWVGACCSQVQFLVSFSRDSKGRCGPTAPVELSGHRL